MKIRYGCVVDILRIEFTDAAIEESDEEKKGIILDYDKAGNVVRMEVLRASTRMENPLSVDVVVENA